MNSIQKIIKTKGNRINTKLIQKYLKDNGLSKTAFCKKCKISYSVLCKVLNGDINFRMRALFKIACGMGLEGYQLFY